MTISLPLACLSSSTSSESEEGREKCVEKERARERERTNKLHILADTYEADRIQYV